MWAFWIVVAFAALVGGLTTADRVREADSAVLQAAALAANMAVYRTAVVARARSTPSFSGTVPDDALSFPAWYVRNPLWTNIVSGGMVTVYAAQQPPVYMTGELVQAARNSIFAGEARAATHTLYSPSVGDTGITLPPAVPDRVPVWMASLN